uniref:Uncharacterized protein LOC111110148 isoform X1 n=1 Tax=Crassostrea virginica TaxID=6565 RepID=A0A8B8BG70_CRAVI|nr:uncharacterized protein LOC111110148 isoform X1 [Crassostrea virginica]
MDKLLMFLLLTCIKELTAVHIDSVVMCPALSVWEARSMTFCSDDPSMYHCLEDQAGELTEICIRPTYIERGHYPVVSIDRKVLKPVKCPPTHFQPNGQMSNEYKKIKCSYMKSVCNDDGEENCSDGNNVEDRTCRCDYTMGYRASVYFVKNPLNKACFQPSAVDNGCIMFNCSEGKELNPAYQCVVKCRPGFHRRKYEFVCKEDNSIQSTKSEITSTTSAITPLVPKTPSITKDFPEKVLITANDSYAFTAAAVTSSVIGGVVLILLITVIILKTRKRTSVPQHIHEHKYIYGDYHNVNIRRADNLIVGEGNIDIRESTEFEG